MKRKIYVDGKEVDKLDIKDIEWHHLVYVYEDDDSCSMKLQPPAPEPSGFLFTTFRLMSRLSDAKFGRRGGR